jgi:protein N-terminal amidase
MDVNPYRFMAPFNTYEFSTFHLNQKSNLVLCSMAWNSGDKAPKKEPKPPRTEGADAPLEDVENTEAALELQYDTIQYWAVRMGPFYNRQAQPPQEAIIVVANRIGVESGMCAFTPILFTACLPGRGHNMDL